MLKTLDKYIDDGRAGTHELSSLWSRLSRDRRFAFLLCVSAVVHIFFYALLIKLDSWAMLRAIATGRGQVSLVKLMEVAPPLDRAALRAAPESLERADISRLQYRPDTADDVHLIQRSPKSAVQRGNSGRLPSADLIERQLRASRGSGSRDRTAATAREPAPPQTSSIQANRIPQLDEAMIAQTPPTQAAPVPPVPSAKPDADAVNAAGPDAVAGTRRGTSSTSAALGLEAAEGQYMAYVRAKIRKANERIMPRDWIKDILRDRVSAEFELVIRRDGQILSTRLSRHSGYPVLDDYARQAIYTASPFEGFPQAAGNAITFTVTVYFFPL